MNYECLICFDKCNNPAILMLNCKCHYNVHYRCYKKWWKLNKNCIICLKPADEPYSYMHFEDKKLYETLLYDNNKFFKKRQIKKNENDLISNKKFHCTILGIIYISAYLYNAPLIFVPILLFLTFIYFIMIIP
jgi:hypothetical protein